MTLNPYRFLAASLRAQLRLEATMDPRDVSRTSWMAHVEYAGTKALVGRGGANTCFYVFGEGERRVDYPAKVLRLLDRLGRQSHALYRVEVDESGRGKTLLSRERAMAVRPRVGWRLTGVDADGAKTIVAVARRDVRGQPSWIPVRVQ